MSNLSENQRKSTASVILFWLGVIITMLGLVGNIVTIFPVPSDIVPHLKNAAIILVSVGLILLFLAAYFWCSDRMEHIDAFIQGIDEMKDVLNKLEQHSQAVANVDAMCQGIEQNTETAFESVNSQLENMEKALKKNSNFRYSTGDVTKRLEDFVDRNTAEITEVHIICFGRNGYEQAINYIVEKCHNIKLRVIFCDTKKNKIICRDDDDRKIRETIQGLLNKCANWNIDIEIYASEIPPAIRASIVYAGNNRAVWGAIQSYNFVWEGDQLTLVRPEKSLIIVGDETCVKSDFDRIIGCIEAEFNRLGRSVKMKAALKDGKVDFVDADNTKWDDKHL